MNVEDLYIPTDEELRDRVDSVAVPQGKHYDHKLHVATLLRQGGRVEPVCRRVDQSGRGWKLKSPSVFPAHKWCKPCALRLFNDGAEPPRTVMQEVGGGAYE